MQFCGALTQFCGESLDLPNFLFQQTFALIQGLVALIQLFHARGHLVAQAAQFFGAFRQVLRQANPFFRPRRVGFRRISRSAAWGYMRGRTRFG